MTKDDKKAPFDRAELGFSEAVLGEFGYLTKLGFRCVRAEVTFVRYESDRVFVNVYHGRRSGELGAEIGLRCPAGEDEHAFHVWALIELADPAEADAYRTWMVYTPDLVKTGVERLAKTFKKYSWGALRGDPAIFSKLEKQQKEEAKRYWTEMETSRVRPQAATAFQQKDYKEAARLYESIQSELTAAELGKLEYARKHST